MTITAALVAVNTILPGRASRLAALGAPATFVCLGHGQNGFLTAALLGGGMVSLERRPFAAGLLLGCLVYKPQFALLLPVVIAANGSRRAFAGATLSSLSLIAATLTIWGLPVWQAFIRSLPLTRVVVIEAGETGWEKIVSVFAAARAFGAPVGAAYTVQAIVTASAIASAATAARFASPAVRGATVACAALLSTPYALDYDLTLSGIAIAFIVADARAHGWLGWERTTLTTAWLVPLAGRQIAAATLVPLNWLAVAALMAIACRRGWTLRKHIARNCAISPD